MITLNSSDLLCPPRLQRILWVNKSFLQIISVRYDKLSLRQITVIADSIANKKKKMKCWQYFKVSIIWLNWLKSFQLFNNVVWKLFLSKYKIFISWNEPYWRDSWDKCGTDDIKLMKILDLPASIVCNLFLYFFPNEMRND